MLFRGHSCIYFLLLILLSTSFIVHYVKPEAGSGLLIHPSSASDVSNEDDMMSGDEDEIGDEVEEDEFDDDDDDEFDEEEEEEELDEVDVSDIASDSEQHASIHQTDANVTDDANSTTVTSKSLFGTGYAANGVNTLTSLMLDDDDDDKLKTAKLVGATTSQSDDIVLQKPAKKLVDPKTNVTTFSPAATYRIKYADIGLFTGSVITLKADNVGYLSRCEYCYNSSLNIANAVTVRHSQPTPMDTWKVEMIGKNRFYLRGDNGKYLSTTPRVDIWKQVYPLNVDLVVPDKDLSVWTADFQPLGEGFQLGDPVPIRLVSVSTGHFASRYIPKDVSQGGLQTAIVTGPRVYPYFYLRIQKIDWKPPSFDPLPAKMRLPFKSGDWIRIRPGRDSNVLAWISDGGRLNRGDVKSLATAKKVSVVGFQRPRYGDNEHWQIFFVGDPSRGLIRLRTAKGGYLGYHNLPSSSSDYALRCDVEDESDYSILWHIQTSRTNYYLESASLRLIVTDCKNCFVKGDLPSSLRTIGFSSSEKHGLPFEFQLSNLLGSTATESMAEDASVFKSLLNYTLSSLPSKMVPLTIPVAFIVADGSGLLSANSEDVSIRTPESKDEYANWKFFASNSEDMFVFGKEKRYISLRECWKLEAPTLDRVRLRPCIRYSASDPNRTLGISRNRVSSVAYTFMTNQTPRRVWPVSLHDSLLEDAQQSTQYWYADYTASSANGSVVLTVNPSMRHMSLGDCHFCNWTDRTRERPLAVGNFTTAFSIVPLDYDVDKLYTPMKDARIAPVVTSFKLRKLSNGTLTLDPSTRSKLKAWKSGNVVMYESMLRRLRSFGWTESF